MRICRTVSWITATWLWSVAVAGAQTPIHSAVLEGCSETWDRAALLRALEIEAGASPASDRLLRGQATCPDGLGAELRVEDSEGVVLARAKVQLEHIPSAARARMLALVWAELLRASLLLPSAPEPDPIVDPHASSTAQPANVQEPTQPAQDTPPARESPAVTSQALPLHVAQRSALFTGRPAGSSWFEVLAGFAPTYFPASGTALFGFDAGLRFGAFGLLSNYGLARDRGALGEISTRLAGARLEVAMACFEKARFQGCGLTELGLAQSRMTGSASDPAADDSGFDAVVSSAAVALSARLSQQLLGVEVMTRAGAARGPSAREDGVTIASLSGLFLALTLSVVVQP